MRDVKSERVRNRKRKRQGVIERKRVRQLREKYREGEKGKDIERQIEKEES